MLADQLKRIIANHRRNNRGAYPDFIMMHPKYKYSLHLEVRMRFHHTSAENDLKAIFGTEVIWDERVGDTVRPLNFM